MIELLDMATAVIRLSSPGEIRKGLRYYKAGLGWSLHNCVYTWRRDGEWLYIGASRQGTARLYNHELIKQKDYQPDDALYFYYLDYDLTWKEVLKQEARLIAKYKPIYNISGKTGNSYRNRINAGICELFYTHQFCSSIADSGYEEM